MSRPSAREPRFRGSVGARPPAVYAVSRVERYLECPFKYFAAHVLQLEEERDDESGLTPQERGQLLHGVFEAFFLAWERAGRSTVTSENVADAIALFAEVAEAQLRALPEADRALERTYLLGSAASPGLAERAFAFEIEQGVPVLERLLEHPLEGRFRIEGSSGSREVQLRGKADRIDLLRDGTFRVVDYKLGRAPKPARALQLPIYGVAARQQLEGHQGRSWSLACAGYVAFREKNPFVELGGRSGSLDAALRDGQDRLLGAIEAMEAGEFPVSPDEPWMCTRCGFPHLCRKDYVGDE
jgi:ATP-dependent helicase/DNAse subunit B